MSTLVEEINTIVDQHNKSIGVGEINHVLTDFEKYLNLTEVELKRMTKEDCAIGRYILMQYSMSIYKKINRLKSILSANQAVFNRAVGNVYDNYPQYMSTNLIIGHLCNNNPEMQEMQNEILKLEAMIYELDGMSDKLNTMAQTLRDLSFSKV